MLSLLFLYAISSSNLESLHSLIHEHEATVLHNSNTDSDACDIRLYNPNRDGGCDHDAHLVQEEKCSLCDVQLNNAQITTSSTVALQVTFCLVSSSDPFDRCIEGKDFQSPGRAPPLS